MKEFYRGAIHAMVLADGSVRIEGLRIRKRDGKPGITIHPNTAKHLAEWLVTTLAPPAHTQPVRDVMDSIDIEEPVR